MKLLFTYLKQYKALVFLALLLAAINQVFSLLDPSIIQRIIDNYVVPKDRPLSSITARRLRMLLERLAKSVTTAAIMSSANDNGRVKNVVGSPRDNSIARRRFSSIIGPRMKPRISGAASQCRF